MGHPKMILNSMKEGLLSTSPTHFLNLKIGLGDGTNIMFDPTGVIKETKMISISP
jgi:hypothetical protein